MTTTVPDLNIEPPYGPQVIGKSPEDPVRRHVASKLRAEYDSDEQPSIRVLEERHKASYGTIRRLLQEAGTELRPPRGR